MADSLDDFFAKKDKKRRNKNQASALSAEALVRELEVGSKQSDYSSARRDGKSSAAMELLGLNANDNDWKDFEEVEKRDYTGLKVKEMSIQDQEEEQRRFHEQVEQVPESIPWKSKEETVAAIISSKDLNPFTYEYSKDDEGVAEPAATPTGENTEKAATSETQDKKTEGDTSEAVSSQTSTQDQEPNEVSETTSTTGTDTTPSQEGKPSGGSQDATPLAPKKDGDNSTKASAKYVPPHERMASDVKVLEPVKLSKLTGPRSKASNQAIDIKDEKSFPSLG